MWVTKEFIDVLIKEEIMLQSDTIDIGKLTPRITADLVEQFLCILPYKFEPYSEDDIIFGLYPNQIEQTKLYDISSLTQEDVARLVKMQLDSMLSLSNTE